MYLIVGLGNPGKEYENTRHNLGFRAVEALAKRLNIKELKFKSKLHSYIAETEHNGHKLILAQPDTFMNNSGLAVQAIMSWYKIPHTHLVVIYDDVDLQVGEVRTRPQGSPGGHHGMESIIAHIGTTEFNRVRIGIGRESLAGDVSDYVLSLVPAEQAAALSQAVAEAAEAALLCLSS